MTRYEVLRDDFDGRGPFTGREIEEMIESGEIGRDQDVRKVESGKVIQARYALSSPGSEPTPPDLRSACDPNGNGNTGFAVRYTRRAGLPSAPELRP